MKNRRILTVLIALFPLFFLSTCDLFGIVDVFESRLRGKWESASSQNYHGSLEITFDTIKITGFSDNANDPRNPFRTIMKGIFFEGYSTRTNSSWGTIYIKKPFNEGTEEFLYEYDPKPDPAILRFTFDGMTHSLKRKSF